MLSTIPAVHGTRQDGAALNRLWPGHFVLDLCQPAEFAEEVAGYLETHLVLRAQGADDELRRWRKAGEN